MATAGFRFHKVEGLGNDFVLVQATTEEGFDAALVSSVCDRRFGVGADGVLLVLPPRDGGAARMKVINADGSVPEMCGNGLRCVVLFLAEIMGLAKGEWMVETDAGPRLCRFELGAGAARIHAPDSGVGPGAWHTAFAGGIVDVDMGLVRVTGNRTLGIAGEAVDFALADAGNPHAIAWRDDPESDLAAIGPVVATHPSFEKGTNVELVRWKGDVIEVAVWERGVGRTLACGTGACAVAAVAWAQGKQEVWRPVTVRLPGGELVMTRDAATGKTRMKGPARIVFTGEWGERRVRR